MQTLFLGRQPIYDRRLQVFAYELLFRTSDDNVAVIADAEGSTAQVVIDTFIEIGLENVVGQHLAFVNVSRAFLLDGYARQLPKERVVLEILEDVTIDDRLIACAEELAAAGYTIALDDFVYHDDFRPLLGIARIIKVDLRRLDEASVREHVRLLTRRDVKLLAEKVETKEEFDRCLDLGFDLFQGYYFQRPTIVTGRRPPTNRLAALRLLAALQSPNVTIAQVEALIGQDATISYRVLRVINSAMYGLARRVDSLHEAVVLLGLQRIRTWVTLMTLSGVSDKPHELLVTAMVRARMASQLTAHLPGDVHEAAFTVGLFSALDAILDLPMDEIVSSLPLSQEASDALLRQTGPLGEVLGCILLYERGDWDHVRLEGQSADSIRTVYLESVAWASEQGKALAAN